MKYGTVINPQQMSALKAVVDAYCRHVGIATGSADEEAVASRVVELHEVGLRGQHDLLAALLLPPSRAA